MENAGCFLMVSPADCDHDWQEYQTDAIDRWCSKCYRTVFSSNNQSEL